MPQNRPNKRLLRQATVRALAPDGIKVVSVGTILFLIGSLICLSQWDALKEADADWFFAVSVTGFIMGLLGIAYIFRGHYLKKTSNKTNEDENS